MATSVKLPRHEGDTGMWAQRIVQILEKYLNPFPEDQVGSVVIFIGSPPEGVLPADGTTVIDQKKYPVLFKQIGSTMPSIPAPGGFTFGLVAR